MEANQTTCPQCGLVNNHLAEACVQCGLIFVKNQTTKAPGALRDEQKAKAIEEAEAILDQTLPPPETDAFGNDIAKMIDLPEDTVELQIPVETSAVVPEEPKLEENQDLQTHEIEMGAIEAPPEGPADAIDAEALFLSEISTTQTAGATVAEAVETDVDSPAASEKAADSSDVTVNLDSVKQDGPEQKKVDTAVQKSETAPAAKITLQGNSGKDKSDTTKFDGAEPIKTHSPSGEVVERADKKDHAAIETGPAGQKMLIKEKQQPVSGQEGAVQSEAQIRPEATIEMPPEPAEAHARAKKQELSGAEKAQKRQNQEQVLAALKRQREKQANVQASSKEQMAQADAGASEKKKLAMAKAEALKKQKAAQAKAEALKKQKAAKINALAIKKQMANQARLEVLKKQKEAQAKAEASAQEMEVASAGILPAASKGAVGNHEKLLSLLKRYKGKAIGINYDNSAEIKEAELVDANEEFFSVMVKDKKLQYSYPLKTILTIVEGQEGVETGDEDQKTKFDAVIKVYPLVLFK
jgi:hypothetical protein